MTEFWALLGQIFIIVIAQSLVEKIIGDKGGGWAPQIISVLCYCASLYLVLKFVFDNYVGEMYTMFTRAFQ